ncbi:hypothetical protein PDE_03773 [Penicillium oxalicum 114-2]|uniref:Uncharacterized protein n=1 Tax=Penicillium oxalicum (strain 114-2 / CGMCC 5302) TaxID=933388 RepID=S8B310_PENO1|nr:hypothetical protein PDE_03773 [Penicillium oxalicum 114-2]
MTRKTHLHLQQYLPKAHKALQKHLHKVKRVVNSLNLNHHPPGASQTCSDRLDERDQQIIVELRYTQARKDTPPLHQRRGLEMSPIIQPHPSLYREITGAYRRPIDSLVSI